MFEYEVKRPLTKEEGEQLSSYPEILQHLLFHRGVVNNEEALKFLTPNYDRDNHDPFLLPDMERAVERVLRAIDNNEKIVIFSDYDADGIPGGVVLHDFFKKIGYQNFVNYIPHRHLEGFGLNMEAVQKFIDEEGKLLITIDCGIVDFKEIELAMSSGLDVIITDHHMTHGELPKCTAIINPKREDSQYPFKYLCSAGVIYKLIQGILKKRDFGLPLGWEKWLLDMVGLATISDMVELTGENRSLATYGLKVLRKSPRLGLQKLLSITGTKQHTLREDDVGFTISPRINVASRLGEPRDAFILFSTTDDAEADVYARGLDKMNTERKTLVAVLNKAVKKIITERYPEGKPKVVVLGNPDWRPGLLGLVANKVMEEHGCPVFLWGREGGEELKGSCRAPKGVSIVDIMSGAPEAFIGFGGHPAAGGFSVSVAQAANLEEALTKSYDNLTREGKPVISKYTVDREIHLDDVNFQNYKTLEQLSPFGMGNPKPVFLLKKVVVSEARVFGKEKNHLEVTFLNSRARPIKAIAFFNHLESYGVMLAPGVVVTFLANMELNNFRGANEIRLRIIDLSISHV